MLQKLDFPDAELYLQGAHLTRFKDWLYLSSRSHFEAVQAIRGGIPVVFPWFGPKRDDASAPQHGWARTMEWESVESSDPDVVLLRAKRADWEIHLAYHFGPTLRGHVAVQNVSSASHSFELALHTYFAITDVTSVEIEGLDGLTYIDKTRAGERFVQTGNVQFGGEVDRVYLHAPSPLHVHDGESGFELKGDWQSAVTWNPGPTKAATMKDVGEGEWQKFVCLEVGAIADNAVTLDAGEFWTLSFEIARLP